MSNWRDFDIEAHQKRVHADLTRIGRAQENAQTAAKWNGNVEPTSINADAPTREDGGQRKANHLSERAASSAPLERDVLPGVLGALKIHPRVAWAHRMNVMAQKIDDRFVRAGFPGLSDIIGQLKDGRMLAVEVKRPGGQPTQAQVEFLGLVHRSGGVSFVARSVDDVIAALDSPLRAA